MSSSCRETPRVLWQDEHEQITSVQSRPKFTLCWAAVLTIILSDFCTSVVQSSRFSNWVSEDLVVRPLIATTWNITLTPKPCGVTVLLLYSPVSLPCYALILCIFFVNILWGRLMPNVGFLSQSLLSLCYFVASNPGSHSTTNFSFCSSSSVSCLRLYCLLYIIVKTFCLAHNLMLYSNYWKISWRERGRQLIEITSVAFILSHNCFGNFQCIQTSVYNFI